MRIQKYSNAFEERLESDFKNLETLLLFSLTVFLSMLKKLIELQSNSVLKTKFENVDNNIVLSIHWTNLPQIN